MCASTYAYSQYFPIDTTKLNRTFSELTEGPSTYEKQIAFLEAFPSTFTEYMMVYQYVPDPAYDLTMYRKISDHLIKGLGTLTLVPDTSYCNKIINLCLNARGYGDAQGFLRIVLKQVVKHKLDVMFDCLNKKMPRQQFSLWYFYFNSIVTHDREVDDFEHLKKLMNNVYPTQVLEMEAAYKASHGKAFIMEDFPYLEKRRTGQN